ncbi:MAG: cbb3-type cytochrome c oxidase subunit I [Candidatus Limnocylindria bacterium]
MTLTPRVNPRKLRPYDEPPKRRRPLIPESPGSAAIGFLVAAAVWFAAATGLGMLAVGLRILPPFEFAVELGVFGLVFTFDGPRVAHAFVNATAYGWLSNAGLAAICFMTPRLLGRDLAMEKGANLALVIWNLSVAGGITALYFFETGPHASLTAFPWLIDGGLALALLIVTGAFVRTAGARLRSAYISAWFAIVALLSFLALTAANAVLGLAPVSDLAVALGSAYISRAIETLWLVGTAYAVLYYVVPRATGNPLASSGVATLGWLLWLLMAPLAGLAVAVDTSVPYVVTTIGSVATIVLMAPAFLAVMNLLQTIRGRWTLALGVGTVPFALVALAFLLATVLLQAIGALRSVYGFVVGTDWAEGAFVFAALGAYSFAMLALAEHAQPRLLRRAWGGGILAAAQLWPAFAGATLAGVGLIGAGLAQASFRLQAAPPDVVSAGLLPYHVIAAGGMGLLSLAGLAALLNLFLLYTSAEPIEYAAPSLGTAAAAAGGH